MKNRFLPLLFCLLFVAEGFAQQNLPQDYFKSPLDIPLFLAGTFGELRSNHFHSGLDLKTQQRTGLPVHSSADGYVSRIKIQRYGYGKALYIQHPNGYTTVYGHLERFSPSIQAYVKKMQYKKESYTIELFPKAAELPVKQGELVAYSGETGGAAGPHVHFEIRDAQQRPMNPLDFGIKLADHRTPTIRAVYVYPQGDDAHVNHSAKRKKLRLIPLDNGNYKTESFTAYGKIGFGVRAIDKMDGSHNKDGLYRIKSYVNGNQNFQIDFRKFSFAESRLINRFIDYSYYIDHRSRIQQLFLLPHNTLSMYKNVKEDGFVTVKDNLNYQYKIEVSDFEGNTSVVNIPITTEKIPQEDIDRPEEKTTDYYARASQATAFDLDKFDIYIPKNALFDNTYLDIETDGESIKVHHPEVALRRHITIGFDVSKYTDADKEKLFIARMSKWGTPYYNDTHKKRNRFTTKTRTFGTYKLVSDTIPPSIKPVNFRNGKWMSTAKVLQFKINDGLTGVSSYRATINGKFILMEYEYKNHMLTYDFSDEIVSDTENNLKIIVTDNVGNSTTFEGTFFRKN